MTRVAPWRIVAACVILAGLILIAAVLSPVYLNNRHLQGYLSELARNPGSASDQDLRAGVIERALVLGLPVRASDIQISRSAAGVRIDVRYAVRVDFPGYTVNLHFFPGAGAR